MELEQTSKRLPIYLVLDTSGSMAGAPIDAVNAGLQDFQRALGDDMFALEVAYISIITFSSDATQVMPLTEAGAFTAPTLRAGGSTSLGKALTLLDQSFDNEVKEKSEDHPGDWKPLVFLMTDGAPTDDWKASLSTFKSRASKKAANLVAIGCGPHANEDVLREVSSPSPFLLMKDMSPAAFRELFKWISQSARVASKSASVPAAQDSGNEQPVKLDKPPSVLEITL